MPVSKNKIRLPTMTPGTARSIAWLRFGRAGARPKVYMQAAIHANELPGAMALHHLMPMLAEADRAGRIRGEVIVVPTVNPIGQSQLVGNNHLGRYDLLSRDNFNRNWLDLSGAVAERVGHKLARDAAANVDLIRKAALAALKAMKPDERAADDARRDPEALHRCRHRARPALRHGCRTAPVHRGPRPQRAPRRSSPRSSASRRRCTTSPLREALTFSGVNGALWPRLAARFPDAAIPQACFSSTVELRSQHEVSHELGASDASQPLPLSRPARRRRRTRRSAAAPQVRADADQRHGRRLLSGRRLHRLSRRRGSESSSAATWSAKSSIPPIRAVPKARTPMRSRTDGMLFSRKRDGGLAWPGMVAFRIAGAKPLAHRKGMSGLDD